MIVHLNGLKKEIWPIMMFFVTTNIHVSCFAHIFNLVVHEGLKDIDESIVRIQNMVKYVNGSLQRLAQVKYCVERKTIGYNTSLTLDVSTR
jgi:hypothetical protein